MMKSTSTLRHSLVKVKQGRPNGEEGCSPRGAMQGLPMCVHWSYRKNLAEMSKQTQDSSEEDQPQEWDCSSHLGKPAPGQLGSRFSQAR